MVSLGRLIPLGLLLFMSAGGTPVAIAGTPPAEPDGCSTIFHFAQLREQISEVVAGECLDKAHEIDPHTVVQSSPGGMFVWDEIFAKFTDGSRTWILSPSGATTPAVRSNNERFRWERHESPAEVKPPDDLSLFLLAGQSNMSGYAPLPEKQVVDPRTFLFGNDYRWHEAIEPSDSGFGQLDQVSYDGAGENDSTGYSAGSMFAHLVADNVGDVGLIPCAKGGSMITEWQQGLGRDTLYGSCLNRAKIATMHGHIAGILFYQGEAEAQGPAPPAQPARWGTVHRLRGVYESGPWTPRFASGVCAGGLSRAAAHRPCQAAAGVGTTAQCRDGASWRLTSSGLRPSIGRRARRAGRAPRLGI